MLVLLSRIATHPLVAGILIPAIARALKEYFESRAKQMESSAAIIQAKAASQIADNEKRAEILRDASRKLSNSTDRS